MPQGPNPHRSERRLLLWFGVTAQYVGRLAKQAVISLGVDGRYDLDASRLRVGCRQASKRFLGVDAIRLSGDRRLQAERTKAGVPLPMALPVKLDRLAEALHLT